MITLTLLTEELLTEVVFHLLCIPGRREIWCNKHSLPQVKWFEQQRELRRVKRDGVSIEQHVKKRDFGDGPDPVALPPSLTALWTFSFQSEFGDGLADDIWDGIFAEMKGESSTESQKRKRQNSFASSFSDPMFRWCWIYLLSTELLTT